MKCHFVRGQKVVCVNADRAKNLELGKVYTVKAIRFHDAPALGLTGILSSYGLLLVEAEPNKPTHVGFCPTRFKPAVERKTDISIFTDMLIQQKQPVQA